MTDELKPVRCGCGGEATVKKHTFYRALPLYSVKCDRCGIQVPSRNTETDAITAWNKAMGERTAKVKNIAHVRGYPMEGNCGNCGYEVVDDGVYCPGCGAKLDGVITMSECNNCEEYDNENHYCPKWCRVIGETIDDIKAQEKEERTAKVTKIEMPNSRNVVYKCNRCGQYMHRTSWSRNVNYCSYCGARLEWE